MATDEIAERGAAAANLLARHGHHLEAADVADLLATRAAFAAENLRLRGAAEAALRLCGFCLGGGSIWVDEDGKRRCETPESRPPYRPVPCPACGPIRRALDAADAPAGGPEDSGEGCDA